MTLKIGRLEKSIPSLSAISRLGISSSPSRIGLDRSLSTSMEEYTVHNCGGWLTERNSLHPVVDYGMAKALGISVQMSERYGMQYSGCNQFPTSITHSPSNEYRPESPRALIDAHGNEKSQECPSSKPLLVEQMDINCTGNKVWSQSWLTTEEEEFDWEDMKSTLIDHGRNQSLLPSTVGFSGERPVLADNATLSEQNAWKYRSSGSQLPPLDDSSAMEMKHSLVSSQSHCARKTSHHPYNSSQHIFSDRDQARTLTNPPINHIRRSYLNPYGVPHAVPKMLSGVASNVKPPPSVVLASSETTPSANQDVTRSPILNPILPGQISSNQKNHWKAPQPQFFPSQDPSTSQFSQGMSSEHGESTCKTMLNPLPPVQFPSSLPSIANYPFHPSHSPASSQMMIPHPYVGPSMSSQQADLLTSQISHVISRDKLLPTQKCIGTEFNAVNLKVRYESVVNALYGDLPRQCSTCGLRFRSHEEHRSHMDWHVTKNRALKTQKQRSCRQWLVSERMWLSGAQALGTKSVPAFSPTETKEEKKNDEEFAVSADEDQKTCALCEEPFDEFYSDEIDDWMYRGAAYLYQPTGTLAAMDRSQLGPIIHAKCRSESKRPPSQHLRKHDYEEGTPRKRMRI
ncbi:hypothetical protein VNO80_16802 [Phaseolus coccineus]|uniref:C2H2-type domain-containing protein n=1 Tax=Phaseolus coccineus TaxID=3886 RepID=A0AAN9R8C4_PHACN